MRRGIHRKTDLIAEQQRIDRRFPSHFHLAKGEHK
jgi:hypothetical protein